MKKWPGARADDITYTQQHKSCQPRNSTAGDIETHRCKVVRSAAELGDQDLVNPSWLLNRRCKSHTRASQTAHTAQAESSQDQRSSLQLLDSPRQQLEHVTVPLYHGSRSFGRRPRDQSTTQLTPDASGDGYCGAYPSGRASDPGLHGPNAPRGGTEARGVDYYIYQGFGSHVKYDRDFLSSLRAVENDP